MFWATVTRRMNVCARPLRCSGFGGTFPAVRGSGRRWRPRHVLRPRRFSPEAAWRVHGRAGFPAAGRAAPLRRHVVGRGGRAGVRRAGGDPVSGMAPTSERMCPGRSARTWPRAIAIMTATASLAAGRLYGSEAGAEVKRRFTSRADGPEPESATAPAAVPESSPATAHDDRLDTSGMIDTSRQPFGGGVCHKTPAHAPPLRQIYM